MAKRMLPHLKELYGTAFYTAWSSMKTRCNNPKFIEFNRYGGRGITYPEQWETFKVFYDDMYATYSPGLSLDRIDNDADYSKDNCRWATLTQQSRNRITNRLVEINGTTKTLAEWIESSSLKSSTVRQRFYTYKWPIEKALGIGG